MTNRKPTQIIVQCSRGIANEMCRYDNSKIVSEKLLEDKWGKLVDKWVAEGKMDIADADPEKENHRLYQFTIEGVRHTVARWSSFGVRVQPA